MKRGLFAIFRKSRSATAQLVFETEYNNVHTVIEQTVNDWVMPNSEAYLVQADIPQVPVHAGRAGKSADVDGRRMIVLRTDVGNIIIYERYAPYETGSLIERRKILSLIAPDVVMLSEFIANPKSLTKNDLMVLFVLGARGDQIPYRLKRAWHDARGLKVPVVHDMKLRRPTQS